MRLADRVRACRRCPGLNLDPPLVPSSTRAAPGYGDTQSPVVIIGQSLCGKKCIEAQIPFTGGSGRLLDQAFEVAGVKKSEIFITNLVHCHPPGNRPSLPHEIANCSEYLAEELKVVFPKVIIGLGRDTHAWLIGWNSAQVERCTVSEGWDTASDEGRSILLAAHPSWAMKRPVDERSAFVGELATAISWAFANRDI